MAEVQRSTNSQINKMASDDQVNKMATEEFDVVVVGAGVAGLTAAYNILKKDPSLRILVLEARGRVGGRTCTQSVKVRGGKTDFFDLGAQWVGPTQHHILKVIDELGLETFPQYCKGTKLMQLESDALQKYEADKPTIGSWIALLDYTYFMWKMNSMAKKVPMSDPYSSPLAFELEGLTVAAMCDKMLWTKAARKAVDQSIKGNFGTDASRLGMLFCLAYANAAGGLDKLIGIKDTAQEFRLTTGTQPISECLADRLGRDNIRHNCAVVSVDQLKAEGTVELTYQSSNDDTAILKGEPQKVRAKKVVVTVPPNLLTRITWSPPMHALKKNLCETMLMGHLYKFIVTYEQPHWIKKGYSGELFSNGGRKMVEECSTGPLCEVYDTTTPGGAPALVGFIAGRTAIEWCQKTKNERCEAAVKCLVECFGPEMKSYIAYEDKMWGEDPWAGGCPVTYGTPGTLFALPHIRTPQGSVHFAGTETSTVWTGYMSGAVQSGERAAWEVLMDLQPNLLTEEEKRIAKETRSVRGQFLASAPPSRWWEGVLPLVVVATVILSIIVNLLS